MIKLSNYSFEKTTASEQIYSLLDLRFVRIDSKSCYCFIIKRKKLIEFKWFYLTQVIQEIITQDQYLAT